MNKKICFAGLVSDLNLGDQIILESTKNLYRKEIPDDFETFTLDLTYKYTSFLSKIICKIRERVCYLFLYNNSNYLIYKEIDYFKNIYKKSIVESDLIVFVGGGIIKYKYQKFYIVVSALIKAAEELNIPVIINAVGVEGFDDKDNRCLILKKHLNMDVVKNITTRDDLFTLKNFYFDGDSGKCINKIADSAVYCDEAYNVSRKKSSIYGIGLIRGEIFLDNQKNITKKELAKFYADLIIEFETRNLEYQIFTNGFPGDVDLIDEIKEFLSRDYLSISKPVKDTDLVEVISSFKAIVAARLHANIIAYSLNIPSIGIVWNEKLSMFGFDIGYPERFFDSDKLNAKNIVDALIKADNEGYVSSARDEYRCSAKKNISSIVNDLIDGRIF